MLISEIGMNHNGSMETAKEMIRVSKECGADLVKGQAFIAGETKGSMPNQFYADRQLNVVQCIELILYAREIGIEMFFSIFSKEFDAIRGVQKYHKYSAGQSKSNPRSVEGNDKHNVFASVNLMTILPKLSNATVLFASSYLAQNPRLYSIDFLKAFYKRPVGYSDHTLGIDWCLNAVNNFDCKVIEKHFTLTRDIYFEGVQFRDAIHAADPKQLETLARAMK